jgi:hypothetical protein
VFIAFAFASISLSDSAVVSTFDSIKIHIDLSSFFIFRQKEINDLMKKNVFQTYNQSRHWIAISLFTHLLNWSSISTLIRTTFSKWWNRFMMSSKQTIIVLLIITLITSKCSKWFDQFTTLVFFFRECNLFKTNHWDEMNTRRQSFDRFHDQEQRHQHDQFEHCWMSWTINKYK